MRLIVLVFLSLLISGCNSLDSKSTEETDNVNTEIENEAVTKEREITENDKRYIELLNQEQYELVVEETENLQSDDLLKDYFYLASALKLNKEIKDYLESIDGTEEFDHKLYLNYMFILDNMEKINYVPDQFKAIITDIEVDALIKEKYYSDLVDKDQKQIILENQQKKIEDEIYKRKLNPLPVEIGMTKEEVISSGWGKPEDINRTITKNGTREQWVYPNYKYLYFEDGILTTIQD